MKRGEPLRRRTRLRSTRSTLLRRSTWERTPKPLPRVSDRRRARVEAENRPAVRAAVFARDGYRCRLAGVDGAGGCFGHLTPHHVRKEVHGGPYTLGNLVTLCAHHNDQIEADADLAALARRLGLVKKRGDA